MLQLDEENTGAIYPIKSYNNQSVTVGSVCYTQSIIVSADTLIADWDVHQFGALTLKRLQTALDLTPEILLLGTGLRFHVLPAALKEACKARSVAVETMTTPAACRSYTALLGESRRVVAALIIEHPHEQ